MERRYWIILMILTLTFAVQVTSWLVVDFSRAPGGLQAQTTKPHALPTGTHISPPIGTLGLCELTVDNTNKDVDAVVKLVRVDNGALARFFYIQRGRQTTITEIEAGTYKCYAHTGLDWNSVKRKFNRKPTYSKFDLNLTFREIETEDSIEYSTIKITLYQVRDGNAKTRQVNKKEFQAQGRQ
ncbi:MAG: hypothetical protein KIT45_11190 [Fimbriimonadia bacterium]|nr:hypothetical protein [Fimbriimonadia bacterium]